MYRPDIRQIEVCKIKGIDIAKDAYILDFGCGQGQRVYQLIASGYKNSFGFNKSNYMDKENPVDLKRKEDINHFRFSDDGSVPYPDDYFDLVISDQVFEHVLEQGKAFREIHRVLKKGGVSVHVFPAKWQIIEPHIHVPLGGLIKSYHYYYFWAKMGIRTKYQEGLSARAVATKNINYARTCLNYLSCRQYGKMMAEIPFSYGWEELAYMQASYKPNVRRLAALSEKCPLILSLIRSFNTRVLFLQK